LLKEFFNATIRLTTGRTPLLRGRLYRAKIMVVLNSTNRSLPAFAGQALRSLAFLSPVRDELFVEIIPKQKNEPHRGGLYLKYFFVLILTLLSISGVGFSDNDCKIQIYKAGRNYNPVGYDLSNPDKIDDLPGILHEISGITEIDNSTIASIQDENGVLVIYDLSKSRISNQFLFHSDGDYEGIARAGNTIFVLRSDGELFEIPNYKSAEFTSIKYKTEIPAKDNEGLCYYKKKNMLLIGPKSDIEGKKKSKRAIYGFSLETKKLLDKPVIKFDPEEIKEYATKNKLNLPVTEKKNEKSEPKIELRTSAIGIHPLTNKLFLISGIEKILFVFDLDGTLEYMEKLDPELFNQPEGITFLNNGDMLISNEGGPGKATLLRFNYKIK
jgi:hypothetical protein